MPRGGSGCASIRLVKSALRRETIDRDHPGQKSPRRTMGRLTVVASGPRRVGDERHNGLAILYTIPKPFQTTVTSQALTAKPAV